MNKGSSKSAKELAEEWDVPLAKAPIAASLPRKPVCICEECASPVWDARNQLCTDVRCPIVVDRGIFMGVRNGYDIGSSKITLVDPSDMDPCDCTNCGCK